MQQELDKNVSYQKSLVILCISTALFGLGCILLGYVFLPFAAASYAALLQIERKANKLFSFIIPIVIFAINLLINGFFSLEATIYVAIGLILYFSVNSKKSKAQTVFNLTLALSFFILLSFLFVAFDSYGSLSFHGLKVYYGTVYDTFKSLFINLMSGISQADENGALFFLFTRESAENIFHSIILALPSFLVIFAFIITGITYKIYDIFCIRALFVSREQLDTFIPGKFVAYTYVFFAIFSFFSSRGTDAFALTIANFNTVLMTVFAYFGLRIVFSIIRAMRNTLFAVIVIVLAFALLSTTVITILSFIGVFFALTSSKMRKEN